MSRADISFNERREFYLYIDEFQNFATESFENILSEARKYKLSLVVANQYISQINEKIRNAIFGNV
nr:TraM recognition domain-containing protein [Candidatus Vampirococcus lugosii]